MKSVVHEVLTEVMPIRSMLEMKFYCQVVQNAHGLVGLGSVCSGWEGILKNLLFCPTNFCFLSCYSS